MEPWDLSLLEVLFAPLGFVMEPSKRIYWLFLLSAGVLACVAVALQQRRVDLSAQLRALFNRHYWFNRSTRTDYLLLFANNALRVLLVAPLLGGHLAATILVGSFLQTNFGDAPVIPLPYFAIGLLFTVIFFLLEDLSRFSLHAIMHRVPWLWRLHRVHHAATTLTPITVHRVHPLEMTLYYLRGLVVFGLVGGVFIYLFKNKVHGWEILGVDCLGFFFNFLGANLRHSHIRLSFYRAEKWFISPMQHQIHHSSAPQHHNKNFGTCLALWDRLYGSWQPAKVEERLYFGLNEPKVENSTPSAKVASVRP